ncbi:MAG: hypothetical protein Q9225_006683 [Loekoesia sp. 1 TL-2023]
MTERQAKACTTGMNAKASSATYIPVQRGFGLLSSQHGNIPAQQHRSLSPMQRWMSERPGESPYHNIGFVANSMDPCMQTAKSQSKQQAETSSNQATIGSWRDEALAEKTEGKKKKA